MTLHISLIERSDLCGEIYRQIRQAILDGRLRPGERLSPSREMASALAVSRSTVTTAYERLESEGFTTSQVGAGTFVSPHFKPRRRAERSLLQTTSVVAPRKIWHSVELPTAFARPARFDFRTGLPDAALFPHRTWRRVTARSLRALETAGAVYENPAGLRELREAIVRHVTISRGVSSSPDNLVITNGTQQALDIVGRVMLKPGDVVAMEDPGYQPPKWLFQSLGVKIVGVPVDSDGIDVASLPRNARVIYVTPSHQFPLGVAMSLTRRQALIAWAERNEALIIEDDYDSEFRFGGRPLEALQALDTAGCVAYVGSFSKTMLPTLRLGFMVVPAGLREAAHKAKFVSDWHTPILGQRALAEFIEDGSFARHIRRVGNVYRERHHILTTMVDDIFRGYLQLVPSSTGLHVAAYARGLSASLIDEIASRAEDLGVAIQRLSYHSIVGKQQAGVVLGYGAIQTDQIANGLRRLKASFDEVAPRVSARKRSR
jgi:GntR family transcriptional regulator/MocR family aminotransferase